MFFTRKMLKTLNLENRQNGHERQKEGIRLTQNMFMTRHIDKKNRTIKEIIQEIFVGKKL